MSLTVCATVVLGCKLTDIAKEETRTSTLTRYDETTGQPYQKTITEKKVVLGRGSKAIEFDGWGELREHFDSGKAVKGISFVDSGGELGDRYEKAVIGIELGQVGKYSETPLVVPARLPARTNDVHRWLSVLGMAEEDWKTYLVLYIG